VIPLSLNWDITKCADPDALLTDEQYPTTEAMVMFTMGVGIGELTDKTAPEFYARLVASDYWPGITPQIVARYIGLRTNVFPQETRAKWMKRVITSRMDESVRKYARVMADEAALVEKVTA
jgi:hypothetical protein